MGCIVGEIGGLLVWPLVFIIFLPWGDDLFRIVAQICLWFARHTLWQLAWHSPLTVTLLLGVPYLGNVADPQQQC